LGYGKARARCNLQRVHHSSKKVRAMKLFNTIAIWDYFVVAETSDKASEALLTWIAEGVAPSESVSVETSRAEAVRAAWRPKSPLIASDISDDDFKKLEGKTTIEIFERIYTKRG
jgi:hypothetical protein